MAEKISNGSTVQFRSTGRSASGSATALDSSGKTALTGTVSGGINRTHIDFTIRWDSGPRGHYTGNINADGFASGTTNDEANPGPSTNWGGRVPLGCATPAPPGPRPGPNNTPILAPDHTPPAQPAAPAQPPTVTVRDDVDVYNMKPSFHDGHQVAVGLCPIHRPSACLFGVHG
jgi:hypothetical protein